MALIIGAIVGQLVALVVLAVFIRGTLFYLISNQLSKDLIRIKRALKK